MVKIKSKQDASKKYVDSIGRVPAAYKEAVSKTSGVIDAAIAAEPLWKQKMEEAIASGRRAKALARVTDADWRNAAETKGAARIGQGMQAGAAKQAKEWAPYHDALEALDLPPKTADPMTNVTNRVGAVVKTLVDTKKQIKG